MHTLRLLIIGLTAMTVLSCNSAKKAYNKGDYEHAVRLSITKLREDPDNRNARRMLVQAYPKAVEVNLATVQAWSEVDDARLRAADVRYRMGVSEFRGTTRESAKIALEHFMIVEQFQPGYKDTRSLMEEALERATLHVVVAEMPKQQRAFQSAQEAFEQELLERIGHRSRQALVRFYSEKEVESQSPPFIDHQVSMQFESFSVGNVVMERVIEILTSADSVKVGDIRVDGQTIPVFNRVSATFTTNSKMVLGGGQLLLKITDHSSGRIIMQERFDGEYRWLHRWATFNGDERALTPEQKRLTLLRDEIPPPPEFIFEEFTQPMLDKVTERMRRFYAQQ